VEDEPNTGALLYQAYLRLAEVVNGAAREMDPRVRAAHAAVFIHRDRAGIRLTRLAEKAMMTPQAMGELVDGLERTGYLRRIPDPSDRRAKLIVFSERGEEALAMTFGKIADVELRLAELLGEQQLKDLRAALNRISADY
jgi:DNA-binding MarR family transcriptional regulator